MNDVFCWGGILGEGDVDMHNPNKNATFIRKILKNGETYLKILRCEHCKIYQVFWLFFKISIIFALELKKSS